MSNCSVMDLPQERAVEPLLLDLAYAAALPVVATNEAYFAVADDFEAHDALICIAEGQLRHGRSAPPLEPRALVQDAKRDGAGSSPICPRRSKTRSRSRSAAPIARSSAQPILPQFVAGGSVTSAQGAAEAEELRRQSEAGLAERLAVAGAGAGLRGQGLRRAPRLRARRHHADELPGLLPDRRRLHQMGEGARTFPSVPAAARAPARSSPTRSPSPISIRSRFGLLFERFLNPERVSMPDFDIDFCQDRRDEVIDYVQREIRRRPRRADHHLRQAAGPRRAARCRPRAADALWPGRPALQARAEQSGQSR